jgi:hypothetical protein
MWVFVAHRPPPPPVLMTSPLMRQDKLSGKTNISTLSGMTCMKLPQKNTLKRMMRIDV